MNAQTAIYRLAEALDELFSLSAQEQAEQIEVTGIAARGVFRRPAGWPAPRSGESAPVFLVCGGVEITLSVWVISGLLQPHVEGNARIRFADGAALNLEPAHVEELLQIPSVATAVRELLRD
jgi:hypothetical protein